MNLVYIKKLSDNWWHIMRNEIDTGFRYIDDAEADIRCFRYAKRNGDEWVRTYEEYKKRIEK